MIRNIIGVSIAAGATQNYDFAVPATCTLRGISGAIKFSANTLSGSTTVIGYPLWNLAGTLTAGTAMTTSATVTTTVTTLVQFTAYPTAANYGPAIAANNFRIAVAAAAGTGAGVYDINIILDLGHLQWR